MESFITEGKDQWLFYIVDTMSNDGLVTIIARASANMVLIWFSRHVPVLAPDHFDSLGKIHWGESNIKLHSLTAMQTYDQREVDTCYCALRCPTDINSYHGWYHPDDNCTIALTSRTFRGKRTTKRWIGRTISWRFQSRISPSLFLGWIIYTYALGKIIWNNNTWWHHGMGTLYTLLSLCAFVTVVGGSPSQRHCNQTFWCFLCY